MQSIQRSSYRLSLRFKLQLGLFLLSLMLLLIWLVYLNKGVAKSEIKLKYSDQLVVPHSSVRGGFYPGPLLVDLHIDQPDCKIYYTLDGTRPDLNATLYTHPIVVDGIAPPSTVLTMIPSSPRWKPSLSDHPGALIIRAIAVNDRYQRSAEWVNSFFIAHVGSFPVISLVVDPDDLFGYEDGIYVLGKSYGDKDNYLRKNIRLDLPWWEYPSNYLLRGADAERPAYVQFFEPDGKLGFESPVGVRINGNATRGYAQKSLRVSFDRKNGPQQLNYDLFRKDGVHKFRNFILRNSGNDWDKTMFRDGLMQSLMKGSAVDIQEDRPSVVFINGEYWGIHNIRERFDENYIANKYGLPVDSIVLLELGGNVSYGKKSDNQDFLDLLDFMRSHDLSQSPNYDLVCSKIEITSFIDFLIPNLYFCNSDWPNNNVRFWKYKGKTRMEDSLSARNGKWRWMLYDMDWGMGYNSASTSDQNLLPKATQRGSVGVIFSALLKNAEFRSEFNSRFHYWMDGSFASNALLAKIDSVQRVMDPEIKAHIDRWRVIGTYNDWLENVEVMRDFVRKRGPIQEEQLNQLLKKYSVPANVTTTIKQGD